VPAAIPVTSVGLEKLLLVEYSSVYVVATDTAHQVAVIWVTELSVAVVHVGAGTMVVAVIGADGVPVKAPLSGVTTNEYAFPTVKPVAV
jgi:hypothetical protein